MGFFDIFKKKKKEFDFGEDLSSGLDLAELNDDKTGLFNEEKSQGKDEVFNPNFNFDSQDETSFNPSAYGQSSKGFEQNNNNNSSGGSESSKTQELILAKLDTIRSELSNVQHRLDKIEENTKRRW